jgi:hypothetical protein
VHTSYVLLSSNIRIISKHTQNLFLQVPFLNTKSHSERRDFIKEISLRMKHLLRAQQELIISYGSKMHCMYLVSTGIAFSFGVKGSLSCKVYTSGKFFGVEGVLISRRFDYEVRALNYVQLETIAKADVDYIMWSGEYPETHRLIKRARIRLVFKRNLFRYLQVQLTKVPSSPGGRASITTAFTAEETNFVCEGELAAKASTTVDPLGMLGGGDKGGDGEAGGGGGGSGGDIRIIGEMILKQHTEQLALNTRNSRMLGRCVEQMAQFDMRLSQIEAGSSGARPGSNMGRPKSAPLSGHTLPFAEIPGPPIGMLMSDPS